jgi:hypothetical protein
MLRNLKSPETYFQAAVRVQSRWAIKNPDGDDPNREEMILRENRSSPEVQGTPRRRRPPPKVTLDKLQTLDTVRIIEGRA